MKKTYERLYLRNRKYRIRSFWTSVFLIALLVIGYRYARNLCQEYEDVQPHHVVESEVKRLSSGDYTGVFAGEDGEASSDEYIRHMADILSGREITYQKVSSSDPSKCLYDLLADGEKFGRLYLKDSGYKSKNGFSIWTVEKTVSYIAVPVPKTTHYVRAQETSAVTVNNVALTSEHVIEAGIDSIYDGHLLENAPSQKECIYAFTDENATADVVVVDSEGLRQQVELIDGVYTAIRNYDNEEYAEFRDLVEKTLKVTARYTVGLASIQDTRWYIEPSTTAYDYLYLYSYGGSEKALSINDFEDIVIDDFVKLSEDSFACVAKSTYTCRYSTKGEIEYKIDYLLFYKNYNGAWRVYDIVFR